MNSKGNPVRLGVDLGGTGTRIVAVNDEHVVLKQMSVPTAGGGDATADLAQGLREVADGKTILMIGIGASGPIDEDGIIRNPDTLPAFTGVDLPTEFGRALAAPTYIENDAVTAALYEAELGAAIDYRSLLMITLGTGVGVSLIIDGRPIRGADGVHPEAGHLSVCERDAECYCGRDACWEQVASRTSLERLAARSSNYALPVLADHARNGDTSARAIFDEYGRRVAGGLADLLTIYRPGSVVFGGGGASFFDLFNRTLRTEVHSRFTFPKPELLVSKAGAYGGAIGATLLDEAS